MFHAKTLKNKGRPGYEVTYYYKNGQFMQFGPLSNLKVYQMLFMIMLYSIYAKVATMLLNKSLMFQR